MFSKGASRIHILHKIKLGFPVLYHAGYLVVPPYCSPFSDGEDYIIVVSAALESRETLHTLGFTKQRSHGIWQGWLKLVCEALEFAIFIGFVTDYMADSGLDTTGGEDY